MSPSYYTVVNVQDAQDFLKMARFVRKVQDVVFQEEISGAVIQNRFTIMLGGQVIIYTTKDQEDLEKIVYGLGKDDGNLDYTTIRAHLRFFQAAQIPFDAYVL